MIAAHNAKQHALKGFIQKKTTTTLTGKNAKLQHKTSHHRKAEENKAMKKINDNYYGNIIHKKCLNFALL
jgi:hypothetical protein